jgi:hypothetical protein
LCEKTVRRDVEADQNLAAFALFQETSAEKIRREGNRVCAIFRRFARAKRGPTRACRSGFLFVRIYSADFNLYRAAQAKQAGGGTAARVVENQNTRPRAEGPAGQRRGGRR